MGRQFGLSSQANRAASSTGILARSGASTASSGQRPTRSSSSRPVRSRSSNLFARASTRPSWRMVRQPPERPLPWRATAVDVTVSFSWPSTLSSQSSRRARTCAQGSRCPIWKSTTSTCSICSRRAALRRSALSRARRARQWRRCRRSSASGHPTAKMYSDAWKQAAVAGAWAALGRTTVPRGRMPYCGSTSRLGATARPSCSDLC
mmetsp:Transcript_6213/g.15431  ORF Transcript_6213/g.15431 Transcript_6213/m.15431 type:complete len:206 (-) Transcript_6213:548-1165(-)